MHQVADHLFDGDTDDVNALASRMMAAVQQPIADPVYVSMSNRLLPILRDLLMYQCNELVLVALTLIFRMNMMRSEASAMLQEVLLLHSSRTLQFYEEACAHAVRLQVRWGGWQALAKGWGHGQRLRETRVQGTVVGTIAW